jgi:hypothetical protein
MAARITLPSAEDVAEVVNCLLTAADTCATRAPDLAARRRLLAHQIGDALDLIPIPAPCNPDGFPTAGHTA